MVKKQLLINEVSLFIATLFLIIATFSKNINLILLGLALMAYSFSRIEKLKEKYYKK